MKKSYSAPQMDIKTFSIENIITTSGNPSTADQIENIQAKMNEINGGEKTMTDIIAFSKWN